MADTLKLEIVTPEGTVYSEDVEMVTLPGVAGQLGVYPQHVPLMTQMVPGEIIVRKDGRDHVRRDRRGTHRSHRQPRRHPDGPCRCRPTALTKPKPKKRGNAPKPVSAKSSRTRKSLPSTPRSPAPWPSCASSDGDTCDMEPRRFQKNLRSAYVKFGELP